MLNWIVWNRIVFDVETVYKQKTILLLNRILWNRTVYMYKIELALITYCD